MVKRGQERESSTFDSFVEKRMNHIEELSFRVAIKCQRMERNDDSQLEASSIQSQVPYTTHFNSVSFDGLLALLEPFHRSLVDKMEDSCTGPSSSEIIDEISVFKGSSANRVASWSRHARRKLILI
jgi:hypothetical protein